MPGGKSILKPPVKKAAKKTAVKKAATPVVKKAGKLMLGNGGKKS
jgi:hypothetical protein